MRKRVDENHLFSGLCDFWKNDISVSNKIWIFLLIVCIIGFFYSVILVLDKTSETSQQNLSDIEKFNLDDESLEYNIANLNHAIVDQIISEGYFTQQEFTNYINNLTFQEVFGHMSSDTLIDILFEEGYIRSDITSKQNLLEKLLEKNIDIYKLELRPDGLLTAIADIRLEGSLFVKHENDSFTDILMKAVTAKEGLKNLFENDRLAFVDRLKSDEILKLLGADLFEGEVVEDPIMTYTWISLEGKYMVDPIMALSTGYLAGNEDEWTHYDPIHSTTWNVSDIADYLNSLPEGQRYINIHGWSVGLGRENTFNNEEIWLSHLDPIMDLEGNKVYKQVKNGTGEFVDYDYYYFPSYEHWTQVVQERMAILFEGLKEADFNLEIDGIILDYEDNDATGWSLLRKAYKIPVDYFELSENPEAQEILIELKLLESDLSNKQDIILQRYWDKNDPRQENWTLFQSQFNQRYWTVWATFFYQYDFSPLLEDPRTAQLLEDLNITEEEILNSYRWAWGSEAQIKWDKRARSLREKALNDSFYSVARRYYPEIKSVSNYASTLKTDTVPYSAYYSVRSLPGLGDLAYGNPSNSFYGGMSIVITPEKTIESNPPYYPHGYAREDKYMTAMSALTWMINAASSSTAASLIRTSHWVAYRSWGDGKCGAETYLGNGENLGNAMAESWFRISGEAHNINFWNDIGLKTPEEDAYANQIMDEVNEILGYSDRRFLTEGWVIMNGKRIPLTGEVFNYAGEDVYENDILVWASRANGTNIYRIILDLKELENGQDRWDAVVNNGSDGNPLVITLGDDNLSIPYARIYEPIVNESSEHGFWAVQSPDDISFFVQSGLQGFYSTKTNEETGEPDGRRGSSGGGSSGSSGVNFSASSITNGSTNESKTDTDVTNPSVAGIDRRSNNLENPSQVKSRSDKKNSLNNNWLYLVVVVVIVLGSLTSVSFVFLLRSVSEARKKNLISQNAKRIEDAKVYIQLARERGFNEIFIRNNFLKIGWPEGMIDSLMVR
jgi:hypothetical protein